MSSPSPTTPTLSWRGPSVIQISSSASEPFTAAQYRDERIVIILSCSSDEAVRYSADRFNLGAYQIVDVQSGDRHARHAFIGERRGFDQGLCGTITRPGGPLPYRPLHPSTGPTLNSWGPNGLANPVGRLRRISFTANQTNYPRAPDWRSRF